MRALCWFTAAFRPRHRATALAALLGVAASGCTLITDIDREKIPDPPLPPFPEVDAGPQPGLDASTPEELDASLAPPPADAASDAGVSDAGSGGDSGT